MGNATRPLWMALHVFGEDAAGRVLAKTESHERELSDAELAAIARASTRTFWSDGQTLYARKPSPELAANSRELDAHTALLEIGLHVLYEARERGGVPWRRRNSTRS
jgi:hypothetical protein